jgi:hypothetical protein
MPVEHSLKISHLLLAFFHNILHSRQTFALNLRLFPLHFFTTRAPIGSFCRPLRRCADLLDDLPSDLLPLSFFALNICCSASLITLVRHYLLHNSYCTFASSFPLFKHPNTFHFFYTIYLIFPLPLKCAVTFACGRPSGGWLY